MNIQDKIINNILFFGFLFSATGCRKFVEVPPPTTLDVTSNVFANQDAATGALTAIYAGMESNELPYVMSDQLGMLSDELTNYSTILSYEEYYTNSLQAKDIVQPWTNGYNYIYQANAVISGLEGNKSISEVPANQLLGEAEFIRAFWLFYLTECYGALPLPLTPNYEVNASLGRTSQTQVYQQIVTDLKDAENLLQVNYVNATDTTISMDRVRPNKWAAAALLARTYLFAGYFDSAEQQASLVINNTGLYRLCPSLDTVFLHISSEAIWQIPPSQPSSNLATPEASFILVTAPQTGVDANATISPQLLNAFENGDQRMAHWVKVYSAGGTNYYFPFKYKVYSVPSGEPISEYSTVLRLAEQYLIRAEARAQQGNLAGALLDLDVIRNRAGLANYNGTMDQSSIISAVLHEKQVELFTEWGARWLDLNRTGTIDNVMSVVTPSKIGSWMSSWALFPLPFTELNIDHNLVQNPNY